MFERKAAVFLYAVSPVHLGAGSAVGVIDNPIQRERHTGHASFAGSGIEGGLPPGFEALGGDPGLVDRLLGPASQSRRFVRRCGKLRRRATRCLSGAQPAQRLRCLCRCSPQALARARRLLALIGVAARWAVAEVAAVSAAYWPIRTLCPSTSCTSRRSNTQRICSRTFPALAQKLAARALPADAACNFFREPAQP